MLLAMVEGHGAIFCVYLDFLLPASAQLHFFDKLEGFPQHQPPSCMRILAFALHTLHYRSAPLPFSVAPNFANGVPGGEFQITFYKIV